MPSRARQKPRTAEKAPTTPWNQPGPGQGHRPARNFRPKREDRPHRNVKTSRVELRGFEPLTFCMPCRRATSCAIAPHFHPPGGTETAYRFLVHVSYSTKTRGGHGRDASQDEARQYTPATLIPVSTRAPRASAERSPPHHPHRQAARRLPGPPLPRHPGAHNAITDVPGIEVGYQTLIQADSIRTG